MLGLAQDKLPGRGSQSDRAQEVAIKPAHPSAQRLGSGTDLRLLDRRRKNHVEAHDLGAGVEDGGHDAGKFPRPGDIRSADERRRAIGFLVESDDDAWRRGGVMDMTDGSPPQRGERIDRQPAQNLEHGGRAGEDPPAALSRSQTAHRDSVSAPWWVRRCLDQGASRSSRPAIGVLPGLALLSTWNITCLEPMVALVDARRGELFVVLGKVVEPAMVESAGRRPGFRSAHRLGRRDRSQPCCHA